MSYDSYPAPSASGVNLPPSSRYNPYDFKKSTEKVDKTRFEYYMQMPDITIPTVIGLEYPRHIVDTADAGPGYFMFEEFNSDEEEGFWDEWISDELDRDTPAQCDGSWTFANHMTWIRFRNDMPDIEKKRMSIAKERMFIAYITKDKDCIKTTSIVIAVCVYVQPGGIFNVSGITKSNEFMNDDEYKGVAFKLLNYIARVIRTKLDHATKGLLFRPNCAMRERLLAKIPKVVAGDPIPESGLMGCFVGSNWDTWWYKNMRKPSQRFSYVGDKDPSIIQTYQGISFRILKINKEFNDYDDAGFSEPIPVPFWEPPSPYPNPDSPNNPQLPLIFVPIDSLAR